MPKVIIVLLITLKKFFNPDGNINNELRIVLIMTIALYSELSSNNDLGRNAESNSVQT